MAAKGTRTKKEKENIKCLYCGKEKAETNFYRTNSEFYKDTKKLPYCKECIEELYQKHYERYVADKCHYPEKKAIKRLCMFFDVYWVEDVFHIAADRIKNSKSELSFIGQYMAVIQLAQYNNKKQTYENTLSYEEKVNFTEYYSKRNSKKKIEIDEKTREFFGDGFTDDDYNFLKTQYDDWVTRHECQTKAQEEVFKRICFKQLEILKATRLGEDTKDLDSTFQKLLDTAKLQPKQNAGDAISDAQTFGTLIDKWENTRPLPEIDEELRDIDKIALYIDAFYKGHICKMLNKKNAFSNLYSTVMKKFTVNKPEYKSDEDYDSELIFDKMLENVINDDDKGVVS